jgi:hypothetical protein
MIVVNPTKAAAIDAAAAPIAHLNNAGLARFSGAAPVTVHEAIRLSGATRVSKGRYRAYHDEAMPTASYTAMVSVMDASPRSVRVTARTVDYVEVRVTDLLGAVQDPTEVMIETKRVVTP